MFALNLPIRASEDDVVEFFEKYAGPVLDVRLVRDRRTGRSKGVGYVEFGEMASVSKALACSSRLMQGHSIMVQVTQTEKNKAAEAKALTARLAADTSSVASAAPVDERNDPALRTVQQLFIGGLELSLTDADLRALLRPLGGSIVSLSMQRATTAGVLEQQCLASFDNPVTVMQAIVLLDGCTLGTRLVRAGAVHTQRPVATLGARCTLVGSAHSRARSPVSR